VRTSCWAFGPYLRPELDFFLPREEEDDLRLELPERERDCEREFDRDDDERRLRLLDDFRELDFLDDEPRDEPRELDFLAVERRPLDFFFVAMNYSP
jgi:hypothetical protein